MRRPVGQTRPDDSKHCYTLYTMSFYFRLHTCAVIRKKSASGKSALTKNYSEASMSIIFGGPDNGIVIFFYNNMNVLFEIF